MPTGSPYPWYLTSESIDESHNRIVAFVDEYRATHEWGPTVDDIAKGTGAKVNTVRQAVDRLIRSGYLVRPGGKQTSFARTLRKSTEEEKQTILVNAWVHKLKELPAEERRAALDAAFRVNTEETRAALSPAAAQ